MRSWLWINVLLIFLGLTPVVRSDTLPQISSCPGLITFKKANDWAGLSITTQVENICNSIRAFFPNLINPEIKDIIESARSGDPREWLSAAFDQNLIYLPLDKKWDHHFLERKEALHLLIAHEIGHMVFSQFLALHGKHFKDGKKGTRNLYDERVASHFISKLNSLRNLEKESGQDKIRGEIDRSFVHMIQSSEAFEGLDEVVADLVVTLATGDKSAMTQAFLKYYGTFSESPLPLNSPAFIENLKLVNSSNLLSFSLLRISDEDILFSGPIIQGNWDRHLIYPYFRQHIGQMLLGGHPSVWKRDQILEKVVLAVDQTLFEMTQSPVLTGMSLSQINQQAIQNLNLFLKTK